MGCMRVDCRPCSGEARLCPACIVRWLLCGDGFGEWKVYVAEGKMSQAVLRACVYSQGISRKVDFLNWGWRSRQKGRA